MDSDSLNDISTIDDYVYGLPVKFSKKSSDFLIKLIGEIKKENVKKNFLDIKETEYRMIGPNESIPTGENYNYIPQEIRKSRFLEFAAKKYIYRATVKIHQRTFNFMIMHFQNVPKEENLQIVKQACLWLLIASNYAPIHCSNVVNVNFYMTDAKKILPQNPGEHINMFHVNTALTTACNASQTTINLFRKEEWFKVFIHETFHNLGMDFSSFEAACGIINKEILHTFHINSRVRLYETYCEMWAEIINIVILTTTEHMRMFPANIIKIVEHCLQLERAFSLFQTVKILKYFGIKYADLLNPNGSAREKYKERTEVFSYFVLKSILMYDTNMFVEWCVTHNRNGLQFNNPETNIIKYGRTMILAQHDRSDFLRAIENIEETMFSSKKRVKKVNYLYTTLRMSVFG